MDNPKQRNRNFVTSIWLIVILAIVAVPVTFAHSDLGSFPEKILYSSLVALSLGLSVAIFGSFFSVNPWKNILVSVGLILVLLVTSLHLGFLALVLFSGRGFGPEVFIHAGIISADVALSDFKVEMLIVGFVLLVALTTYLLTVRGMASWRKRYLLLLGLPAFLVVGFLHNHLPAWDLYVSWKN